MRCSLKTLTVITMTLAGLMAFLVLGSRIIILESYLRLEEERVRRNVSRAFDALTDDISTLSRETGDWAAWDETYDFVKNPTADFARRNLPEETYQELLLSLILVIDDHGRIIHGQGYDLVAGRPTPLPAGLQEYLRPDSPLLAHSHPESAAAGLILLREGPLLLASRPILTSERTGPIRGALIMGRFFDAGEIDRLGRITHLALAVEPAGHNDLPDDFAAARRALTADRPVFVHPAGEEYISGFTFFNDLFGSPGLLLRVDLPREIYAQGRRSITYFLASFGIVGVVIAGICFLLIDKLLLSRQRAGESEERFRSIFEHAAAGMNTLTPEGRLMQVNPALCSILGFAPDELRRLNITDLTHPEDVEKTRSVLAEVQTGERWTYDYEKRFVRSDGRTVWGRVTTAWLRDSGGKPTYGVALVQDITKRKQAEQEIEKLAFFDTLTDLPNRTLLRDRLQQALAQAGRDRRRVGVLFLDLDQFKGINDTQGHPAGDRLLQAVAVRLIGVVRRSDTVARLGGDEFVILLPAVREERDIGQVAKKIHDAFNAPFTIGEQETFITASIGITVFPRDGEEADTLLRHADTAMYAAKERGRNQLQFFSREMDLRVVERTELEAALRRALDRQELELHYQPQVDLETGRITGMEALLRWRHPEKGMVPPDKFIPIAEESGLIIPISDWVLRTACLQATRWAENGFPHLRLAVNLSVSQLLLQPGFAVTIAEILKETGLDPGRLELEITESILAENAEGARSILRALKELGIHLAIDDFGTGYSSLNYLKSFPLDRLKIDRGFVRDLTGSRGDAAIAVAIIAMAASLGLTVIAEGVETPEQMEFLLARGCPEMQGFLFARPIPPEDFLCCLREGLESGRGRLHPQREPVISGHERSPYPERIGTGR